MVRSFARKAQLAPVRPQQSRAIVSRARSSLNTRSHHMVALLPLLSLAATDSYDRWQVLRDGAFVARHLLDHGRAFDEHAGVT